MAIPLLTWQQTAWVPVTATTQTDYLDAIATLFAASTTWEADESSTNWREFKPVAGSAIPDCRILVFYGALPHANSLKGGVSTPATTHAYIGISVDAGATAPGDPTAGVPYSGKRWSGFVAFDLPATRTTNQIYGVFSEEIVAILVNCSTVDTSWGMACVGAMGVASVADSEPTTERIWMVYGNGATAPTGISSTWWQAGGASAPALLSSSSSAILTQAQLLIAHPLDTASIYKCFRHEGYPQTDAATLITPSGLTVVKPFSFTIESSPKRYGGCFRQMGLGPNTVCRNVLQTAGLVDKGYAFVPSLVTAAPALVFTAAAI